MQEMVFYYHKCSKCFHIGMREDERWLEEGGIARLHVSLPLLHHLSLCLLVLCSYQDTSTLLCSCWNTFVSPRLCVLGALLMLGYFSACEDTSLLCRYLACTHMPGYLCCTALLVCLSSELITSVFTSMLIQILVYFFADCKCKLENLKSLRFNHFFLFS